MDIANAQEIIACLPAERTRFNYFKDRYALQLLGYASGDGARIDQLRAGPYARLLNKPLVRQLLAECGDGRVSAESTRYVWQEPHLPFLLTLGLWGNARGYRFRQTSRPGFNLVLRLNFSRDHDRTFKRLFTPYYGDDSLNWASGHPTLKPGERAYYRETLAWARLDVDLARGEALIEEIQTDWVREARDQRRKLPDCPKCQSPGGSERCRINQAAHHYLDAVFAPYLSVWDEAMLSATLFFLREELGIRHIWYHTWASGNALKGIDPTWAPPRSLYQTLPRQFCFQERDDTPAMLHDKRIERRLRKAKQTARFYALSL